MDYAIQKSVELGVHSVSPLFSTRCEVRLDPLRQEKRKQHCQQIVFSACEQSGRAFTPEVQTPAILETWLTSVDADVKLVLHPAGNLGNGPGPLPPAGELPDSVAVLIGPEGGFSAQEIQLCRTQGFRCLTLGPRILRTETAPVVALTFLQQRWGDLP